MITCNLKEKPDTFGGGEGEGAAGISNRGESLKRREERAAG